MKILVVDDVHENRVLIKTFLQMGGYSEVETLGSATEVYQYLGLGTQKDVKANADLILMDLMMPEIDGIAACKTIKAFPDLQDIPLIMVTANTDSKSLEASFEAGAIDFIKKPLDKIELLTRVRSALNLKKEMDRRKQREKELLEVKQKLEAANNELRRLSTLDSLTGVLNRRTFDEKLQYEWRRVPRETEYISLVMIDIDFFKAYNDTYGHQAGDDCLKRVARALSETLHRPGDTLFRYGGEEFAVILPNTDPEGALHVGEILRRNIEKLGIAHSRSAVAPYVTISAGVATITCEKPYSPNHLIEMADQALYEAKRAGRNRVETTARVWNRSKAWQG